MCRVATAQLEPDLTAAAAARRWVTAQLVRWELTELLDEVNLLVSELVANAVVHAGSGPSLLLAVAEGTLELGVTDRESRLPPRVAHDGSGNPPGDPFDGERFMAEGGRGLVMVDALADEWGATGRLNGKQVWFRLGIPPGWPHHPSCRCDRPDDRSVPLESGRLAVPIAGAWDEARPA